MSKLSTIYICQQCGYQATSYLGKCPQCQSWGSLIESVLNQPKKTIGRSNKTVRIVNLKDIDKVTYPRILTGFDEFDRVLGGGIVKGSVVLISGDPGIGKSTLLTQLVLNAEKNQNKALYVAGEESAYQIKIRVERITKNASFNVVNDTDVDSICGIIEQQNPSLVVIDSIQTLETEDLNSPAGSIGQVRECSHRLQHLAKRLEIPLFIVGHITKDGTVAGPKTLEHLVDVVLSLEGDSNSTFRILRTAKNRFGPTDEIGIFDMEETGLKEVKNPSLVFLDQKIEYPGSIVITTMNGYRPILVEIQALVSKSFLPIPKRSSNGIDPNRLQILTAVISKRLNLPLGDKDIYVNVTGGLRINEPAADLGICMAIISSLNDKSIPDKTVFIGEVGLLGELRNISRLDRRVTESKKLGYVNIISPNSYKSLEDVMKSTFS